MLLGLDYDKTYTRDPDFWDKVIDLAYSRGHTWLCVTNRQVAPGSAKDERVPSIPVLCAGDQRKEDAARAAGFHVHVWIDDMPASISQVPILGQPSTEAIDLNDRGSMERKITGALRASIAAHGNITVSNAPSAAKRVIGAIKQHNQQVKAKEGEAA